MKLYLLNINTKFSYIQLDLKGGKELGIAHNEDEYIDLIQPYLYNEVYSMLIEPDKLYITIRD